MKNMNKINTQLKEQVLNLLNDLIQICPEEKDIIWLRLYFQIKSSDEIMKGFNEWVYPWKKEILSKDEKFFTQNNTIFGPLPEEKVKHFKKLLCNQYIFNQDNKDILWEYFQLFINLIDKYKKLQ